VLVPKNDMLMSETYMMLCRKAISHSSYLLLEISLKSNLYSHLIIFSAGGLSTILQVLLMVFFYGSNEIVFLENFT
jgi:hypothetical protein